MKRILFFFVYAVFLSGCGNDQAEQQAVSNETSTNMFFKEAENTPSASVKPPKINVALVGAEVQLPKGRLTGIVKTEEYIQAIIDNNGQATRLKQGGFWEGWEVTNISVRDITIQLESETHQLSLHQAFHSQQTLEDEYSQILEHQARPVKTAIQFTAEEMDELRSRLF